MSAAPGVYHMLDAEGHSLYVGKARNLRRRVASYFRASGLSPKTVALMRHVARVDTTVTHTEGEAVLLENNLIKTHRPRYNIMLRDDKSYPYIHLSADHPFPRLRFYRGSRRVAGRLFGPYPSAGAVRQTLAQLQKVFPVRQCEDTFFRNRSRPCLQYQMGRCTAPCVGYIERAAYLEDVRQVELFLEGRSRALTDELGGRMETAAANLDFEQAARWRDRIAAIQRVQQKQYVQGEEGDADVIAVWREQGITCIELLFVRAGAHVGSRSFFPNVQIEESPAEVLSAFLPQHYLGRPVPPEIILNRAIPDAAAFEDAFSRQAGGQVRIKDRIRGRRDRWLRMAVANARDSLRRHLAGQAAMDQRLDGLVAALALDAPPERIECFDISHTQGEETVGSCVVFDRGGPVKSDYRRFIVREVTRGDDYAALAQVLMRRYRRVADGAAKMPDLVLIDGGRGQLGAARHVLAELGIGGVPVVAVAKGPSRRPGMERLFLHSGGRPVVLASDSPALHLIQQVRDEAHRFAITGHRQRRGRRRTTSPLEEIEGIGPRRRQALLRHFGGFRELERAGVDDLTQVTGVSPLLARRIYEHLHGAETG